MEVFEKNKIAAVVILYHPKEDVIKNILSYSSYCNRLYIFDNTPVKTEYEQKLKEISGAEYFHDGQNRGIAERLNQGCSKALENGYSWVLTMDQDTSFDVEMLENYISCISKYRPQEEVAAFCTRYSRSPVAANTDCSVVDTDDIITSGMIVNLKCWEHLGRFDEALFIDSVDQDFYAKIIVGGYRIVCFANIYIVHQIGTLVHRSTIKSLYTVRKSKVIHTPLRSYYIYRNMLYLEEKYKDSFPVFAKDLRKSVHNHLRNCILYGRNTLGYIKFLNLAKKDFKNRRMGKMVV